MENLQEKKDQLEQLTKEIHQVKLTYGYNNGFSNKVDLKRFINDNRALLEQSNLLQKQIKELEWELMTPEEKKRQKEIEEKIIKKRGNKSKE